MLSARSRPTCWLPGAVQRLLDQTQPEWVIHCAALANVDACESDPQQAQQMNSEVPRELAEYVARGGARLIHVSTDAVFDGQTGNYSEEDTPNPLGVYARSKLAGELAVAEANPQAIIARVNLFGWSISGKRSLAEFFFNNLSAAKPCMGFTDVYFCPVLANDLGNVFLKMLDAGLSGLYHAVGSQCLSKYEFGVQIARRFGFDERLVIPTSVQNSGLKAARSPNLTLRTEKLHPRFGRASPQCFNRSGEVLHTISTGLSTADQAHSRLAVSCQAHQQTKRDRRSKSMEIQIGKHTIGPDHPTYFIADVAANHDGDLERARLLIRLAKEAGADAAKFQNFRAPKHRLGLRFQEPGWAVLSSGQLEKIGLPGL